MVLVALFVAGVNLVRFLTHLIFRLFLFTIFLWSLYFWISWQHCFSLEYILLSSFDIVNSRRVDAHIQFVFKLDHHFNNKTSSISNYFIWNSVIERAAHRIEFHVFNKWHSLHFDNNTTRATTHTHPHARTKVPSFAVQIEW